MNNNFDFKCVHCGHCCRNEGIVHFTDNEITDIADFIGITPREFKERFLSFSSIGYAHHVMQGEQCIFLKNNLCAINSVKPRQCSSFPYWKEYIGKDGNLKDFNRHCSGIILRPTTD
jgi:uncharacterized protein